MYSCFELKKLMRIIICDAIIIIIALIITFTNKNKWSAYDIDEKVFLPVIMYHSIVENSEAVNEYTVTPEQVESDLKYLRENGYTAVFTEDVINYTHGSELPDKPVIITADDGFYNNLSYLLPLLEKYDMKAVISVVGYFSEVTASADPHIPEYSYLTWADITKLLDSGRIEISNHTFDMHSCKMRKGCSMLLGESYDDYANALIEDIGLCQTLLSINCHTTPVVFTYPFGSISKESIPVLKSMGFAAIYSCYERPNYISRNPDCLFPLDRYNRSGNLSTEEFMNKALMSTQ